MANFAKLRANSTGHLVFNVSLVESPRVVPSSTTPFYPS